MAAWWQKIIPSKNDRELKRINVLVDQIASLEAKFKALPDASLQAKSTELRNRYMEAYKGFGGDPESRFTYGSTPEANKLERKRIDDSLNPLLPEAFALCREASDRVFGMRHYDVQMVGGISLHEGRISEMKTGEGKTLAATLPVYLNGLAHRGVHVITVNEYLAARDARWMGQLYNFLGLDYGIIVHGLSDKQRQAAYNAHVTYGTNSEFGFDYLRDNMKLFLDDYTQRGHHFAIVDEVDSILIDEARTPLIISGPAEDNTEKYLRIDKIIPGLRREQDYSVDEKSRTVVLTEAGITAVENRLNVDNLYMPDNIELLHHVNQGLRAHTLFRRDVDYMIQDAKVKIIDEFTGRVLDGRRWSDGLHQAVEAKEGVKIENENQTLATITYQNYFRMYLKLSGMTGTAETEAEEFAKIYNLDCLVIPTNKPIARLDENDLVFKTEAEKFEAIADEIMDRSKRGQPCLVGTVSVEKSEVLSRALKRRKIDHEILNAKYHEREADIVGQAGRKSAVTIATNMAGRGTDILLGGNPELLAKLATGQAEDPDGKLLAQNLEKTLPACAQEKQEVLDAGGLCIIGTERHESRRIDNQLRGRAGRQGDPGSSRFFVSLEDDLMRIFGGDRIKGLMERLGMEQGEVIEHKWVNKSIENAQRKVEGHHFDIRKHLLEYDDVMNEQRKSVYQLRRSVIGAGIEETKELVETLVEQVVFKLVDQCCPPKTHFDEWNLDLLEELLKDKFDIEMDLGDLIDINREEIQTRLYYDNFMKLVEQKVADYSEEGFFGVARVIYLQTIDALWKGHLRAMDHLREGISLRGYAQKDPKQEYKKEGYNLFASMMASIDDEVLYKVSRVVITTETQEDYEARLEARRAKQLRDQQLRRGPAQKKAAKPQTVKRQTAKVGRNDPCPCGSGKKYKKCCGLNNDIHP